jgi:hypothetical protein
MFPAENLPMADADAERAKRTGIEILGRGRRRLRRLQRQLPLMLRCAEECEISIGVCWNCCENEQEKTSEFFHRAKL